jgi:hypothetical protein
MFSLLIYPDTANETVTLVFMHVETPAYSMILCPDSNLWPRIAFWLNDALFWGQLRVRYGLQSAAFTHVCFVREEKRYPK